MDMALDPADAKRLYIVSPAPASLLVSTDGGVSLSTVASLPSAVTVETKVVVSQNGATICLANGPQLYCSVDSGLTWQARTPVSTYVKAVIYNLIMDPEDSNSLYVTALVSAAGSVANFATHDGGITWQQLTPGHLGRWCLRPRHQPDEFAATLVCSNRWRVDECRSRNDLDECLFIVRRIDCHRPKQPGGGVRGRRSRARISVGEFGHCVDGCHG
jgi:hypothetical protein